MCPKNNSNEEGSGKDVTNEENAGNNTKSK
jgi:hypothetical protein